MDRHTFVHFDAPWMEPKPRPRTLRADSPNPDPAQVSLQNAIVNAFEARPARPYSHAAVSVATTGADDVNAAAVLKLVIDAVVAAGFVQDDRNELLAARIRRVRDTSGSRPTVNVAVLERPPGESSFMRTMWPDPVPEVVSAVVAKAIGYRYVTGAAGPATVVRPGTETPDDYRQHLRMLWSRLLDTQAVEQPVDWGTLPPVGLGLHVRMPLAGNFDPDNVLLYVLDLLETARSETAAGDSLPRRLDEVAFYRSSEPGMAARVYECDVLDEATGLVYFREGHDSLAVGWPD